MYIIYYNCGLKILLLFLNGSKLTIYLFCLFIKSVYLVVNGTWVRIYLVNYKTGVIRK